MNTRRTEEYGVQMTNPLSPRSRILASIVSVRRSRAVNGRFQSPAAISIFLVLRTIAVSFSSALFVSPKPPFSGIESPLVRAWTRVTRVIDLSMWTLTIIVNRVQILVSLIYLILSGCKHGRCPLMYQHAFVIGHPHDHQYCRCE